MEITLKGVAVDARVVVAMFVQECGQVFCGLREILYVEGDVLDQAGRSLAAHSSH